MSFLRDIVRRSRGRPVAEPDAGPAAATDPFFERSVPEGIRIYAIGDVHGCAAELENLLDMIAADSRDLAAASTHIILLGDLIDRGPASKRTLDLVQLICESDINLHCIMGNHEEVLLKALAEPSPALASFFMRIGGRETLVSYGIDEGLLDTLRHNDIMELLLETIPEEHCRLMKGFQDSVTFGDFFFTHAGIHPDLSLDDQDSWALRWIREPFLTSPRLYEKLVVHGHTIFPNIDEGVSRVGIDTGAYKSGVLSALALEGDRHWYLQTPAHPG